MVFANHFTFWESFMPLVAMRQLLDHAAENGYGVPAFNVNNLEQVQAIMEAASELNSPVIMQASAGARKYAGEKFLAHLIQAAVESFPQIPIAMHQDHGASPAVCESAIKLGFSSVMMDGSLKDDAKTVADYDYNWAVTKKVVDLAHAVGVSVEGELGCLGSLETMRGDKEDGHGAEITMTREMLLTDPDQAADFVRRTQLDALAITDRRRGFLSVKNDDVVACRYSEIKIWIVIERAEHEGFRFSRQWGDCWRSRQATHILIEDREGRTLRTNHTCDYSQPSFCMSESTGCQRGYRSGKLKPFRRFESSSSVTGQKIQTAATRRSQQIFMSVVIEITNQKKVG